MATNGRKRTPEQFDAWWQVLRGPLTWTLGAVLCTWEVLARQGRDAPVVFMVVAMLGLSELVRVSRRGEPDD